MINTECAALINEIIAIELKMFQAVNNEGGQADCQSQPETFCAMRHMVYCVLSPQVLAACLKDLSEAEKAGRNVMTEKYALMGGHIEMPAIPASIKNIIAYELEWLQAAEKEQPGVLGGNDSDFCRYLVCELLTYSESTLHVYEQCLADAKKEGRNLALERLKFLNGVLNQGSAETPPSIR